MTCMEDKRGAYRVLVGRLRERDHFEGLGVDGRTIGKWIFKKWDRKTWIGLIWLRIGIGGGLL